MKKFYVEYETKFKEWWGTLEAREQRLLKIGSVIVGVFIIYIAIWRPLLNSVEALRLRIGTEQKLLVTMQSMDQAIRKIENVNVTRKKSTSPVVLLSALQTAISQNNLNQQLIQLKQINNDTIQMNFQHVEFDRLVRLLSGILKAQNVTIAQISIVAESSPGVVSTDMNLRMM